MMKTCDWCKQEPAKKRFCSVQCRIKWHNNCGPYSTAQNKEYNDEKNARRLSTEEGRQRARDNAKAWQMKNHERYNEYQREYQKRKYHEKKNAKAD